MRGTAVKTLPEFGIERAAQLAGCTASHIRNLEGRGDLPEPRLVEAGSTQRRIYNYNEVTRIREIIGKRPVRPSGAHGVRVVFSNLKGGVAKTTMSLHFAQYLAREGYRVLLVDADPQATITGAFGFIPDLDLGDGDDLFPALTEAPDAACSGGQTHPLGQSGPDSGAAGAAIHRLAIVATGGAPERSPGTAAGAAAPGVENR